MAVTSGSEGFVFGPAGGIMLDRDARPIIGGVAQAPVAGAPAHDDATLAASSRDGGRAAQSAQSMIVSPLQSIRCLCEQRGEDRPADAW